MSTDLFAPEIPQYAAPSDHTHRSSTVHNINYLLTQDMYRERLQQAERRRVQRAALRARRALAQQLLR